MLKSPSLSLRIRAAGAHLLASALVATIASFVVFKLWYPPPLSTIAGGSALFLILVSVDVTLGPALTAVIASPSKPRSEFVRDLAVIVVVQLSAFAYGLYTMALARPVALAFEVDRMRVVTAADVDPTLLDGAPPGLRELPWNGPRLLAAVKPKDATEQMRSIELGLAGVDLAMVPINWRPYAEHSVAAWRAARPVAQLIAKYPEQKNELARIASEAGVSPDGLRFLPLMSRQNSWITLLAAPDARVVGHLPVDGFF